MATECWGRHRAVTNARYDRQVGCETCCHPRMYWRQQPQRHGPARSNPRRVFISIQPGSVGGLTPRWASPPEQLQARPPRSELCAGDGAARNIAVHNNVNCERATRRYLVVPPPTQPIRSNDTLSQSNRCVCHLSPRQREGELHDSPTRTIYLQQARAAAPGLCRRSRWHPCIEPLSFLFRATGRRDFTGWPHERAPAGMVSARTWAICP
jgi:hypothetical protein